MVSVSLKISCVDGSEENPADMYLCPFYSPLDDVL